MSICLANIPTALRDRSQWVLWRTGERKPGDKPTKLPYQVNDALAAADDSATWSTFVAVVERFAKGGYDGIGYEFSSDDPYCGIDLDGCRDPETGVVAEWARAIIRELDTYAEVSPSKTGVKLFIAGSSPFPKGRKIPVKADAMGGKQPAIEVYDKGRYFTMTGWKLTGPAEPQMRTAELAAVCERMFPKPPPPRQQERDVVDRARRYLSKVPPAISGQGGHNATFHAACVLVLGFGLKTHEALHLLQEWNLGCQPPWSEGELWHKLTDADKQTGERNYLRFAKESEWESVAVPSYSTPKPPPPQNERRVTTLMDATSGYFDRLRGGKISIIPFGLPSVDRANGGGVERGELVVLAARPSHGKSAVALQIIHNWTKEQRPCVMISEEMSAMALGKRALQYATDVPQEDWVGSVRNVERDIVDHFADREACYIIEACRTSEIAAEKVRWAVAEKGVQCAVIDYAQLLTGVGKTRYEQVTNTSIVMRQLASELNIVVLLLCQLNSEVEKRPKGFRPMLSDIKDSGQFAQDADVIMFLCWPHRLDNSKKASEYQFFIAKNRNRGIIDPVVTCHFSPSRQKFQDQQVRDRVNYVRDFDDFNDREFA